MDDQFVATFLFELVNFRVIVATSWIIVVTFYAIVATSWMIIATFYEIVATNQFPPNSLLTRLIVLNLLS
jgi:hypothetical protein